MNPKVQSVITGIAGVVLLGGVGGMIYAAYTSHPEPITDQVATSDAQGVPQDAGIVDAFTWAITPDSIANALRCSANRDELSKPHPNPRNMRPCLSGVLVATLKHGVLTIDQPVDGATLTPLLSGNGVTISFNFGDQTLFAGVVREKRSGVWSDWRYTPGISNNDQLAGYSVQGEYQLVFTLYVGGADSNKPDLKVPFAWPPVMQQIFTVR